MEYSKILKQAYEATKRNRTFWILGVLITSSVGCNYAGSGGFNTGNFSSFDNGVNNSSVWNGVIDQWLSSYWWILILVTLLAFVIIIIRVILNNIAVGGMIYGAKQVRLNQTPRFGELFSTGTRTFWPILGLHILVKLVVVIAVIIVAIPLIVLALTIVGLIIVIPALIMLALLAFPLSAVIDIILMYARQYIVLKQHKITDSLRLAWKLFRAHLGDSAVIYLLNLIVNIGVGLVTLVLVLLLAIPFAIIGFIAYNMASWIALGVLVGIGLFLLLVLILVIKGVYNAFVYHLWHRTFAELEPNS